MGNVEAKRSVLRLRKNLVHAHYHHHHYRHCCPSIANADKEGEEKSVLESPVLLQASFDGIKEFFTVEAGMVSLAVSPVVTLLRCHILLIGDVGFTKVDSTPPPSSVLCDVSQYFYSDICGLEMSFNDIFQSYGEI